MVEREKELDHWIMQNEHFECLKWAQCKRCRGARCVTDIEEGESFGEVRWAHDGRMEYLGIEIYYLGARVKRYMGEEESEIVFQLDLPPVGNMSPPPGVLTFTFDEKMCTVLVESTTDIPCLHNLIYMINADQKWTEFFNLNPGQEKYDWRDLELAQCVQENDFRTTNLVPPRRFRSEINGNRMRE